MGTRGLDAALARGAPLADILVRFREDIDFIAATRRFNALADDMELRTDPWYDDPALRIGSATSEALERVFSWRLTRVPLERYDALTQTWGTWPDVFRWEELNAPQIPQVLRDCVASIGITQPGADDDGQWYESDSSTRSFDER